jgi:hypothetical protein
MKFKVGDNYRSGDTISTLRNDASSVWTVAEVIDSWVVLEGYKALKAYHTQFAFDATHNTPLSNALKE